MTTKRKRFLGFSLIGTGVVMCCVGLWTLLSPPQYRAAARIKIDVAGRDGGDWDVLSAGGKSYSDFIQTEFRVLQSDVILGKVAEMQDLKSVWGSKDAAGNPLKASEVLRLLEQRMSLRQVPNARLVDIFFRSKDPDEAVRIANAIADTYRDYTLTQCRELALRGIKSLEDRAKEQEQKMSPLEQKVERLKKALKVPENQTNDFGQAEYQPYWEAKRELESTKHLLMVLTLKLESGWTDPEIERLPVAYLAERASLSSPIRPNRLPLLLGLAMVGIGLLLTVRTN